MLKGLQNSCKLSKEELEKANEAEIFATRSKEIQNWNLKGLQKKERASYNF